MAIRHGTPPPFSNSLRTRWPGPFGATSIASTPGGGSTWPKCMLKPCEHISTLPGFRFGLIDAAIDVALHFVGQQDVDHVGLLGRVLGATSA